MAKQIALRPITPEDRDSLYRVYASTRTAELAQVDWDEAHKSAFLRMQFDAQHQYYAENYSRAQFQIVLLDGEPIGRLYVDWRAAEIRIVDIALLPEHCGQGIGSHLLLEILAEGQARGVPVTIHVERFNPALHLYERLGFCPVEDKGVYLLMEWDHHAGSIAEQ